MRTTRTSGVPGPDEHEYESFVRVDEFARAVDDTGAGLHRTSDDSLTSELALVAMLRRSGEMLGPDPDERSRMRQRIMAEFSSVVNEGTSPVLPLRESRRRHRRVPQDIRGRFLVASAAALCLLMSLSGISVLLSQEALPGDPLYDFKRSVESASLGLTFGDENKALKHLEFAKARVGEIEAMAAQADAEGTWATGDERFIRALADFEQDTTAGTRLLTEVVSESDNAILLSLRQWVEQQESRLMAVRGALPLTATTRLDTTLVLLDRVITRVDDLDRRAECSTITLGNHDELGLLPARGICEVVSPPTDASETLPLPAAQGVNDANSADSLLPPGLLIPSTEEQITESSQADRQSQLGLPAPSEGGVLPRPGHSDGDPSRPALGDPSSPPLVDLPNPLPGGGIPPLLSLLPLDNPHVE